MSDDTAKIRLKIGQLEIEYEGKSSFLQDGLFNLLEKTASFYAANKTSIPAEPAAHGGPGTGSQGGGLDLSTSTIAAHVGGNTGAELAIAAAAHLGLVQGKDSFTRKEINNEMKGATTYYKITMTNNLSKSLETLVKNKRLNQVANGTYALSATEKHALEPKLAQ